MKMYLIAARHKKTSYFILIKTENQTTHSNSKKVVLSIIKLLVFIPSRETRAIPERGAIFKLKAIYQMNGFRAIGDFQAGRDSRAGR